MATGRDVMIRLRGEISDFQAKMVAAGKSVGTVADRITGAEKESARFRQGLTGVADTAGKMGLAAAGGVALVTKAAMDWESAFAGVKKTVDETATTSFAVLEDQLREMARTMPATHTEIAAVAEAAGQLGVATEDVASFTRVMVQLGETTNLTADEAATSIAQMQNVMGTAPEDIDNLAAALVAVGNAGASTERQIIQMSQGIAGAANVVGISEAEVLGIANAVASIGIEAEAGGTAISRVLVDMGKATAQGGEDLALFAEAAGLSAEEFAAAFSETPAEAFTAFIEGLGQIRDTGGDVFTVLSDLGLSDVRVSKALLGMSADAEKFAGSLQLSRDEWDSGRAAAEEYAKRLDTSGAQVQIALNNMRDAAIEFGDVALPVLTTAAQKVSGFAQAVGNLPQPVKTATTGLLGLTAVFGSGLWFSAKVINGVADMRQNLSNLAITSPKAASALGKVGRAATVLGGILAAAKIADSIGKIGLEVPGLQKTTTALIDLADAGMGAKIAADFDSVSESVDRLADPNVLEQFGDGLLRMLSLGQAEGRRKSAAKAELEGLDDALSGLVSNGHADLAADAIEKLAKAEGWSRDETKAFLELLPDYEDALAGVENEARLTEKSADGAAEGIAGVAGAAGDGADDVDALTEALEGLQAILEGRSEMREYEQSVDDFADAMGERKAVIAELKQAQEDLAKAETPEERSNARERIADLKDELRDFSLTLDIGTQAGRDWEERLDNIAGTALVAAENLTGLDQRRYLRGARRDFIDAATELGKTRKEARDLWDELVQLDEIEVEVGVNLKTRISGPGGKAYESKLLGDGFAEGGYTGNNDPRQVAGVVHGREFVFDAQMTAMYRPLFEEWHRARRVPGYREGGYVQAQNATTNYYATTNTLNGGGPSIDYDRLASAMLNARPVYGDVTVQPHNYNDFVQQMNEDKRRAALGGANF